MIDVTRLTADEARAALPALARLLIETVEGGASVGFLPPVAPDEADDYWRGVLADMGRGGVVLLAATRGGAVVGSVQLGLEPRANAAHRAEVRKLMVARAARRAGVGTALMDAVEAEARRIGRTLLVLDTRAGDPSEAFYARRGYTRVGAIPRYARGASGDLDATVIFYREV